ncbi:ROK family transcriptional regulator [Microbacterium aoyamense]|uniref:ROK family transcriptional regulator n=1 Tax=Microbacterium aoyamense TaxID=344166 RepID=A0ABP5B4C3_9MICO|nr:ROK family protein [Microbacterium aoyamense]
MTDSAVSLDGVRVRNLARMLQLVHRDGPLSRASLTEATGLNRSTIADLVAELEGLRLVEQREPDRRGRVGRPSPLVAASGDTVAIAANPEIDALEISAVGLDRSLRLRERIVVSDVPTPDEVAALVARRISSWREDELVGCRVVGVGVAVPGLVRASDGLVRDAPHLRWRDVPLRDLVSDATGLPAVVGNDASLGTLAEHFYGAAAGIDDVVYLNGGASGIGGGLIIDGHHVGGAGGYAGEFGQNRPGIAAAADRRAGDGVLEDEVSRARLVAAVGRGDLDDRSLARAIATAGTPDILAEVDRQRRILSTALANAVNVLNPAIIVLGGFLATLADHDLAEFEQAVRSQSMSANAEALVIRPAALAADRLLIGAAELAFDALLSDPTRL